MQGRESRPQGAAIKVTGEDDSPRIAETSDTTGDGALFENVAIVLARLVPVRTGWVR